MRQIFGFIIWLALISAIVAFRPVSIQRYAIKSQKFSTTKLNLIPELSDAFNQLSSVISVDSVADHIRNSFLIAEEATSLYSKVDKTGFVGFFATYIEEAIDIGRSVVNSYGLSIILFTILGELLMFLG